MRSTVSEKVYSVALNGIHEIVYSDIVFFAMLNVDNKKTGENYALLSHIRLKLEII